MTVSAVRQAIADLLPSCHPTIGRAAAVLGTPVRTLQRRLHELGMTYGDLVDQVRWEEACQRLGDPRTRIVSVAAAVGYRDRSSFSRAFVRWTGVAPKEYQRQRCAQLAQRQCEGNHRARMVQPGRSYAQVAKVARRDDK
nr:helix-turn-helix transcriptional regulator [Gammaproteobacteria bacterium]